jgi:hypothetical protein
MTNTTKKTHFGFAVAMLAMLIAVGPASAQDKSTGKAKDISRPPVASAESLNTTVIGVNHTLQRNYFSSGTLGGESGPFLPAFTYEPVDNAQVVLCPGSSGTCTIQADHWIELQGFSANNDAWACLEVDGVLDPFCGYFDNKIPPDGSWVQITSSHSMSNISPGAHIVQTFVNSEQGVYAAYFNINYRVFKP